MPSIPMLIHRHNIIIQVDCGNGETRLIRSISYCGVRTFSQKKVMELIAVHPPRVLSTTFVARTPSIWKHSRLTGAGSTSPGSESLPEQLPGREVTKAGRVSASVNLTLGHCREIQGKRDHYPVRKVKRSHADHAEERRQRTKSNKIE